MSTTVPQSGPRMVRALPPPDPGAARRRRVGGAVLITAGLAAATVAAIVLLRLPPSPLVGEGSQTPSAAAASSAQIESLPPTASGEESPDASAASPSLPPSPPPTPTANLTWSTTASFPGDGGPSYVEDMVVVGDVVIAVGTSYDWGLGVTGPEPPHSARVWISRDGRKWETVALGPEFKNAELRRLVVRPDGLLLALGRKSTVDEGGVVSSRGVAWTSADGRDWTEIGSVSPGVVDDVVQGAKGYLARVSGLHDSPDGLGRDDAIWFSADTVSWEQVRFSSAPAFVLNIGAGNDGFVASGGMGTDSSQPFVLASGDGREWFRAENPPAGGESILIAPRGGDWFAARRADNEGGPNEAIWFSANGLGWTEIGSLGLSDVTVSGVIGFGEAPCRQDPSALLSAGDWLVLQIGLPSCSEGHFRRYGQPQISIDGRTWLPLPFVEASTESRSGSSPNAAIVLNGNLILAGEQNGMATFWLGEP